MGSRAVQGRPDDPTERCEGAPAVPVRVRQRLMVIHYARLHGPTAAARRFGVCVRTIRRWRARWRTGGLEGLVPRYPRRRGRRVSLRVIELVGQARRELAYGASRTQLWLRRV